MKCNAEFKHKLKKAAIHAFFPNRCAACAEIITYDKLFCQNCDNDFPEVTGDICAVCFNPLDSCVCDEFLPDYERACAPFRYGGSIRRALISLKTDKNAALVDFLAGYMADEVEEQFGGIHFDCVTFVPMSDKKRRKTGFDHSELLAKALAEKMQIYFAKLLHKTKENRQQHNLDFSERRENVKSVYVADECAGKTVLLVDDIITTGFTVSECAKSLKIAGADEVYCIAAAKAVNTEFSDGNAENDTLSADNM